MKNSTIISMVALLVAIAGAAIGLAAFFKRKSTCCSQEDSAFEFPFDDAYEDDCCCCSEEECGCDCGCETQPDDTEEAVADDDIDPQA